MIIGLTGFNCGGKTEVSNLLKEKGYKYYSCSDILREECDNRGLEKSRENLIKIGNELREKYGANILAKRLLEKINKDRKNGQKDFVVDSIRNVKEVEELQKDKEFNLIGIDAPIEIRFERSRKRGRNDNAKTLEKFIAMENKEKSENENAQQLDKVFDLADKVIENNSDLNTLKKRLDLTLKRKIIKRLSWDEYFLKIASVVAERATCLRHNIGAVIVKNKRILSTGYNGAVSGAIDCLKLGCIKNELGLESGIGAEICRAVHAEQNAIIQASLQGVSTEGATLYCTTIPCRMCAKMIVNAGIKEVITYSNYAGARGSIEFLKKSGVNFKKIARPSNTIKFKD